PTITADRLAVVPVGWSFNYSSDDHHIDRYALEVIDLSTNGTQVNWTTRVRYQDRNADDNYQWTAAHTVFTSPDIKVVRGTSPTLNSGGGKSVHMGSYSHPSLKGFDSATVV